MPRPRREPHPRPHVPLAVAAVTAALVAATLFGVQAAVRLPEGAGAGVGNATSSGSLRLVLRDGRGAFSQSVSGLAPGDSAHRYVELVNAGSLAGQGLTVRLDAEPRGPLTDDGVRTRAVRAAVDACEAGRWDASTGQCSGRVVALLGDLPLGAYAQARRLAGGELAPAEVLRLRIRLHLPDQDEVVVNGRLPDETVQGQRVALTWVFSQQQRTRR